MQESLMKKKHSMTWRTYEWEYLSKLLDRGYPIVDSIRILQKEDGEFLKQIMDGGDIAAILMMYAKSHLRQHLQFFTSVTSLSNAISCSIRMEIFENEIKKKIKKECFYPIFIFLFAYLTLCIFIQFVIPQLLLSFPLETLDMFFVISLYSLKILCVLIGLLLMLFLMIFLILKHSVVFDMLLPQLMKFQIVKEYISYTFSSYMKELDQDGLSTRKAIQYLSTIPDKKIFFCFMKNIKSEVEEGKELSVVMSNLSNVSTMFQTCFAIGVKTGELASALSDYVIFQEEKWFQKIHFLSIIVQSISYGFVGFLVIMVYQIMLVPLQLLDSM